MLRYDIASFIANGDGGYANFAAGRTNHPGNSWPSCDPSLGIWDRCWDPVLQRRNNYRSVLFRSLSFFLLPLRFHCSLLFFFSFFHLLFFFPFFPFCGVSFLLIFLFYFILLFLCSVPLPPCSVCRSSGTMNGEGLCQYCSQRMSEHQPSTGEEYAQLGLCFTPSKWLTLGGLEAVTQCRNRWMEVDRSNRASSRAPINHVVAQGTLSSNTFLYTYGIASGIGLRRFYHRGLQMR